MTDFNLKELRVNELGSVSHYMRQGSLQEQTKGTLLDWLTTIRAGCPAMTVSTLKRLKTWELLP